MFRLRSNCSVMFVLPCELVELMLVEPRDRCELLFERQRHGRSHRLRARARQACIHLDGRKVDGGQVADRQHLIGHGAEDENPQHQERGRDRSPDEDSREVHGVTFWVSSPLTLMWAPGTRRRCPSVTTVSPACSPVLDHRLGGAGSRDLDDTELDRLVWLDDERVWTLLRRLNRR